MYALQAAAGMKGQLGSQFSGALENAIKSGANMAGSIGGQLAGTFGGKAAGDMVNTLANLGGSSLGINVIFTHSLQNHI